MMSYVKLVQDRLNGNYVLRKGNNILILDDFDGRINVQDMKALCEVINLVYETGYKKGARDERALVLRDVRFCLRESMGKATDRIAERDKAEEIKEVVNRYRDTGRGRHAAPVTDVWSELPLRKRIPHGGRR